MCLAQVDANKGAITGRVVDTAGAPVPNARVLAIQSESGLEREAISSTDGLFRIGYLLPASYEVRVESGSVGVIVQNIAVQVGASVQVNVTMNVQSGPETVQATASVLSVADAEMTQVVPFQAIRDLPINGRRFQEFAALTPTVLVEPETMGQLSFVGQRGVNSNILLDGTDYNEPFLGGIRGGERSNAAFTVPQSAIREFQAVTSGYSAEYGRSSGGVLNAVTRSGTNVYHGEAFYLLRDEAFAADTPLAQRPLERQQQFGGAVGGPAIRDRLFFFGAAEQQFARFPRDVRFNVLDSVQRTSQNAAAYDYFRSLETPFRQTNDATAVLGRGDYHFGGRHLLSGRYQWSRNNALNASALGSSLAPVTNLAINANGTEWETVRTIGGQLTSVLRPDLLNDLRVQHSFEHRRRVPNARSPLLEAASIGSAGTPPLLPYRLRDRRLQIADSFTVLRGAHSLKFGADYSYIDFYQWYGDNQFGSFVISNPDPNATLNILSQAGGAAGNRFDDNSVVYRRQLGILAMENAAHQMAFFAQDTWRVRPDLTVNVGLRWEGQLNPRPDTGNEFLLNNVRNFAFPLGSVDPTQISDHLHQWAPRAGIAWSPGAGRTVVRAQAGLFYAQNPFILYAGALDSFSTTPSDLSIQLSPGARGTVYQQFLAAGIDLNSRPLNNLPLVTVPETITRLTGGGNRFAQSNVVTTSGKNFRNPRATQFSLGVQHELSRGLLVDTQFNYVGTSHLPRNVDYNVPAPFVRPGDASLRPFFGLRSGVSRPNPEVGQVLVRDSSARSRYAGQTVRVQWTRSRFDLAANYTLGFNKSDDDMERSISGTTYQNPFDLSREYNWSALDARHTASGYLLFRAPWGFDVASLFRYRSGLPIDPTTGGDTSELLSDARGNRPLERPGQPFLRNSFRNLDYKTVDVRLLKSFTITESVRVQFSAEAFNLFNFDNVRFLPASVLANNPAFQYGLGVLPTGQMAPVNPGFLRLRTPTGAYDPATMGQQGTPLQGQFGLRLLF
ncbi:MAG TPA: carboxypeptidase regulatory-like domain-containing protein [Bryobacteraceae bacterium]|nr:carboxypeptidase regulatory-like domain-containing protein [Bryobacteraceae bacterium]